MARPRPSLENLESRLKTFITVSVDPPLATMECPRCEGQFAINGKRWRQTLHSVIKPELVVYGRPCPYCFVTGLIPLEFFPKKDRAAAAAQRRYGAST